ncbi:hypothetical protein KPH14_003874 [Odynerus spinipes]|uniref:Uncharacterized protein n=1 Tax=Odynerus spinipes TaxID=1348599 RepID=A0AAD9RYY5_9HYME|nr:hypothetical protein KPH14_003874 [Odynerus spinipes]
MDKSFRDTEQSRSSAKNLLPNLREKWSTTATEDLKMLEMLEKVRRVAKVAKIRFRARQGNIIRVPRLLAKRSSRREKEDRG